MVCYALPVLCTNLGVVLAHCIATQYGRSLHGIGHVYIGAGQHTMLRIILGIIETASTLFRSVSLALRTVCNATAGHVLLAVLLEMTLSRCILALRAQWYVPPSVVCTVSSDPTLDTSALHHM